MTSAERLYPLTSSPSKSHSYKYKLQCQEKLTKDSPSTKDWLQLTKRFEHDSTNVKIFAALLEKRKHVVVKVGLNTDLKREYDVGFRLSTLMSFHCHFNCLDTFNTIKSDGGLCGNSKENKDNISVLVMPFVQGGQLDAFKWTRENTPVYKSVLKHVICTLLYAFDSCSFYHNDMHFGNILLKKTKKTSIVYGDWEQPVVNGYIPVIMDFERSKLPCPVSYEKNTPVYKDIIKVLSLAITGADVHLDIDTNIVRNYISRETPITQSIYSELCDYIDSRKILFVFSEMGHSR